MIKLGAAQVVDEAFDSIVRGAVEGVPGARLEFPGRVSRVLPGRRGPVEWSVTGSHATVSVEVVAAQGVVLPDLGAAVQGRGFHGGHRHDRPASAGGGCHHHRRRPRTGAAAMTASRRSQRRASAFLLYQRDLTGVGVRGPVRRLPTRQWR